MCCGGQRKKHQTVAHRIPPLANADEPVPASNVRFEYFGRTGLTVQGPVSRRTYRFERPGFQIEVDGRDANFLRNIANMKQISGRSR